ncbi:hypothetical protein E2C01_071156 [Portunus trituberculatus]|uniref:Uncharacterized protein n=1 Tax=Portunus trituberculatus TaxID=210409 RepID=A0A5B7I4F6_PORTR|nr:hypothetical protein [Portunus trituberculatus]
MVYESSPSPSLTPVNCQTLFTHQFETKACWPHTGWPGNDASLRQHPTSQDLASLLYEIVDAHQNENKSLTLLKNVDLMVTSDWIRVLVTFLTWFLLPSMIVYLGSTALLHLQAVAM